MRSVFFNNKKLFKNEIDYFERDHLDIHRNIKYNFEVMRKYESNEIHSISAVILGQK